MVTDPRRRQLQVVRFLVLILFVPQLYLLWFHAVGAFGRQTFSVFYLVFFVLMAPVRCGARVGRGATCRQTASGLILGCGMREHRLQRLRDLLGPVGFRGVMMTLLEQNQAAISVVGASIAAASLVVAILQGLVE